MIPKIGLGAAIMPLMLAACGGDAERSADANQAAANAVAETPALPDPASPAAAKAMVERYAALAEKREFDSAADYWTDATAAEQFATDLEAYPKVVVTAGEPAGLEGAAGSTFVTVPVTLDLTLRSGAPYQMTCKATLRRVNDVPGASAKQLRWNIQSIDC